MDDNYKVKIVMGVGFFVLAVNAYVTIKNMNHLKNAIGDVLDYIDMDYQTKIDQRFEEIVDNLED